MKYQLINSIDGTPILMSGKPVFYDNKKDATTGAIGAAFWFGVPVSVRKVQTRKNGRTKRRANGHSRKMDNYL